MAALERSVQQDGWIGAVTVANDGETFDGSARLELGAATGFADALVIESDGQKPVVVRRTDIPSAQDPRALRLSVAANRVAQLNLDFDPAVLQSLSQEIDLSPLWQANELKDLFADFGTNGVGGEDPGPQLDRAEELRKKWQVEAGQLWQLGAHRLLCGDSTKRADVERILAGEKVDALIADPPYGVNERTDRHSKGRGYATVAYDFPPIYGDDKPFDPVPFLAYPFVIFWGANYFADRLPRVASWLIWDKRDGVLSDDNADVELGWCSDGKPARLFRHMWKGIIKASEKNEKRMHPVQKPVALMEWCVQRAVKSDIVFDPFSGSGPMLIACERLKRTCRAIEISPGYVAVTLQRWTDLTGAEPRLL
jgi:site-specific DNA-methyltransferase (adenine-specific)/modification methylase